METDNLYIDNTYGIDTLAGVLRFLADAFGSFTGLIRKKRAFFHNLFIYDAGNVQTLETILSKKIKYKYNLIDYVRITLADGTGNLADEGTFKPFADKKIITPTPYQQFYIDPVGPVEIITEVDRPGHGYVDVKQNYCNFWQHQRGRIANMKIYDFKVRGVDYDYEKYFTDDSIKFQIMELTKNWEEGTSDIEAINLGA